MDIFDTRVPLLPLLDRPYGPFILAAIRQPPFPEADTLAVPVDGSWLLGLVEDGCCRFRGGGHDLSLPPGSVLFVHPGMAGDLQVPPGGMMRRIHWDPIHRPRHRMKKFGWAPDHSDSVQPVPEELFCVSIPVALQGEQQRRFTNLIRRITDRWWRGDEDQFACNALLAAALPDLVAACREGSSVEADLPDSIRRAEAYARQFHELRCRVVDMAEAAGMGNTAFKALYRKIRGESPGAFLRRLRLETARRILRESDSTIAQIARVTGFRSAPAFARAFREAYGQAPSLWRQQDDSASD